MTHDEREIEALKKWAKEFAILREMMSRWTEEEKEKWYIRRWVVEEKGEPDE